MLLKDRVTADMKDAMRAKAAPRLSTIRLILAAIKQREVDERKVLSDSDVVAVIDRMVKQRNDAIVAAIAAARAGGAAGPALMGKAMAILKPALAGRADMAAVSAKVKSRA